MCRRAGIPFLSRPPLSSQSYTACRHLAPQSRTRTLWPRVWARAAAAERLNPVPTPGTAAMQTRAGDYEEREEGRGGDDGGER